MTSLNTLNNVSQANRKSVYNFLLTQIEIIHFEIVVIIGNLSSMITNFEHCFESFFL